MADPSQSELLRIDVGCGAVVKPGFIGIDREVAAGVTHVVDVEHDPLPLADRSVSEIFTSHCLEHLESQAMIFREMSRVAINGASLEIWTPYAWTDEAFLYTHKTFFNELHYLHPCVQFPTYWKDLIGADWRLREFRFVVPKRVHKDLRHRGIDLEFGLRHLKGIAAEFGTFIQIWHEDPPAPTEPIRTYCHTRDGQALPIESTWRLRGGRLAGVARRIARSVTGRGPPLAP